MKNQLQHIIYLIITVLLVAACSNDEVQPPRTALSFAITRSGEIGSDGEIKTIRFIVFDNISSDPKRDVNEYIELKTPGTSTDIIQHTLEVTANNDIMVVVIINEPQPDTNNLKLTLEAVSNPSQLEDIVYNIAGILNDETQQIDMPMVGVIRDISLAIDETKPVDMVVERAVARIDVYVEAENGGPAVGYTKGVSSISLYNISYDSYFVMGNEANGTRDNIDPMKNYGKVKWNIPSEDLITLKTTAETTKIWSYQPGDANRTLFCSYYMGERLFLSDYSDRLAISMTDFNKATLLTGMPKSDVKTISNDSGTKIFKEIRRNNVYKIIAKIGKVAIDLNVSVEPWREVKGVDIDMPL